MYCPLMFTKEAQQNRIYKIAVMPSERMHNVS